jgi:hypothetical protein
MRVTPARQQVVSYRAGGLSFVFYSECSNEGFVGEQRGGGPAGQREYLL